MVPVTEGPLTECQLYFLCFCQIRKLTCGHLGGIKQKVSVNKLAENSWTLDSYLKKKKKDEEKLLKS